MGDAEEPLTVFVQMALVAISIMLGHALAAWHIDWMSEAGGAILVGMVSIQIIKRNRLKSLDGELITLADKKYNHGTWIGGTIFGLGWALTGACPGPLFAQIGAGVGVGAVAILILAALAGTWTYSALRE